MLKLSHWIVALVVLTSTIEFSEQQPQQQGGDCCRNLTDILNRYRVNEHTWTLISRRRNITCHAGRVLYPYGPECADLELSKDLTRSPVIDLDFNITFMGHRFDKVWVNQHGLVSFQESFLGQTLSQDDWPQPRYPYVDDPVFIAPFYAQTDLAGDKIEDLTDTRYGRVLYKVIKRMDLPQYYTEEEKFIYQMTMTILDEAQKQVRESVAGAERFIATHALVVTWKSVAFLGNSLHDIDLRPRNTFQAMIVTNQNYSFAIFNYEDIQWYAATSQGGNPETGTGGRAAKVGFNRGNGTQWYGHRPFSENAQLMQSIAQYSNIGQPGRFVFRIDEWIQPGGCNDIEFDQEKQLQVWPRSGNMLGGQEVNITGPCFERTNFLCKWGDGFDAPITIGEVTYVNTNASKIRGRCVQPTIYFNGRLNLSISLDDGQSFEWKQEFNIVDPLRYPPKVEMVNIHDWHDRSSPPRLIIKWDRFEMSYAESDLVDIELWAYYEDDHGPHWDFVQVIGHKKLNKGSYGFDVAPNRAPNATMARKYKLGAIAVSIFDSQYAVHDPKFSQPKRIFSALHPLGWWRNDEMKFFYDKHSFLFGNSRGKNWAEDQCRWWHQYRRNDRYWMDDLEICPPTVFFAIGDAGNWAPDPSCNMYGQQYNELNCLQHKEASHCVITMKRTASGAGNRCCYDKTGNLMYTNDTMSGSTPDRYHSLGMPPYNTYGKVPGLSHYFHDIVPYYLCCHWSNLCESYLYLRETKDAKGYKEPRMAVAYGDPHLITFDGKDYTFNGKGEFTLFKSKRHNFRLQARFEQPPNATFCLLSSKGQINATRITAIAVGQEDSDVVEVRARILPSQAYDLKCDVVVNGRTYYFNYTEEKVQIFKNVFVLSPLTDYHQSNITIMFNTSGIGVNVECMYGLIHVRAAAPYELFKETAGLMGYWDNITANDFMSPDGSTNQLTLKPDLLYQRFGMAWRLKDESESIFTYSGSWNFDTFHDQRPIIREWQRFRPWFTHTEIPFPSNVSFTKEEWEMACEGDEQCLYDSAAMGSLDIGVKTKESHQYFRLLHDNMKSVNSCGIYLLKGGVRTLSKGNYLSGSVMKISCERGYTQFGWNEFYCNWNGTWLPTNNQWIEEFRDWPYCEHYHITAIRWTSISISIIWTLCLVVAVIYYFFFKKQQEYEIKSYPSPSDGDDDDEATDNEKDYIDFNKIENEEEVIPFEQRRYYKDAYVPTRKEISHISKSIQNLDDIPKQDETVLNQSLNQTVDNRVRASEGFPVEDTDNYQPPQPVQNNPPDFRARGGSGSTYQPDVSMNNSFIQQQQPPPVQPRTMSDRNNSNNSNVYINAPQGGSGVPRGPPSRNLSNNAPPQPSINELRISDDRLDDSSNRILKQQQLNDPYLQRMRAMREEQQRQIAMQLRNQQQQQQQQPPANNLPTNRFVMDSDV